MPDAVCYAPLRRNRGLRYAAVLLAGFILAAFAYVPVLQVVGSFLIVEDSLRPAAAIVALGGQAPFRQIEAARLYHAGWAPLVFVVQEGASDEAEALRELGVKKVPEWELSREVLIRKGVPTSVIIVPEDRAAGTLEELQAVYRALPSKDAPVILVTSKYHTRRTRLTWQHVTGGRSQPIVRSASRDLFDPERWWQQRGFVLSVVREYLGLINYYAGFPVAP